MPCIHLFPGTARVLTALAAAALLAALPAGRAADPDGGAGPAPPKNSYPTFARVQYVQECMNRGGKGRTLAGLYQCSCAIDRIADHLTYDEFVEASTFSHYRTLPGEAGGIFRDPARAKEQVKLFRSLEAQAYRSCGLKSPTE